MKNRWVCFYSHMTIFEYMFGLSVERVKLYLSIECHTDTLGCYIRYLGPKIMILRGQFCRSTYTTNPLNKTNKTEHIILW